MAKGDLTIEASTIDFDEIPEGLERLKRGGVVGRIVASI
jgi:D-arabinose 1-dehydrogenase-like Zn-dependent alcohol dehydrogenase